MPTLITERMLYLHVPKTGGTWVAAALRAAGVSYQALSTRLGPGSRGHANLEEARAYTDRYTVAFVRHPLDVYRSLWANSMRDYWPEGRQLADAPADDFATSADRLIALGPGFVSKLFTEFTGPPEAPISFVGRYESLADDLVRALDAAGEPHDEAALRAVAPVNTNDYTRHEAVYDLTLAERVARAEQESITRWYASDPIPARLLQPA